MTPDQTLAALLARAEGVEIVADATSASTERPISDDRRWIAQVVLYSYAAAVLIVLVATIWLAVTQPTSWEAPAKALLATISQVLLPVVTLVIGFYLRSEPR